MNSKNRHLPPTEPAVAYCARLELPVPHVEDVAAMSRAKLFHLMVVTLLEQGGPMALEAIVERLKVAGVTAATGDLATSLLKSWHGMKPVYRDHEGRFCLEVTAEEMESLIFRLGLRPAKQAEINWQTEVERVSDEVPLTEEEVRAALARATFGNPSNARRIAAALDVHGQRMTAVDLEACLVAWGSEGIRVNLTDLRRWTRSCVTVSSDGKLEIDRQSPHLTTMRRTLRKMALPQLRHALIDKQVSQHRQEWTRREFEQREHDRRVAEQLRRAVLRVVPEKGRPAAVAVLDVDDRNVLSFVGSELSDLPATLQNFDLIAGLWVRDALFALGIHDHDRWRLVDLRPPRKTRQLNRSGRKLTITPEMLISASTGISRPLGDATKVAQYLRADNQSRLRRRIESDAKALFAFYNYGVLHGHVRLRWGFLDESVSVAWAQAGDVSLYQILKDCQESGALVEVITGSAPGWREPWARAVRTKIVACDFAVVTFQGKERWTVPRDEIQAIRIVPQAGTDVACQNENAS